MRRLWKINITWNWDSDWYEIKKYPWLMWFLCGPYWLWMTSICGKCFFEHISDRWLHGATVASNPSIVCFILNSWPSWTQISMVIVSIFMIMNHFCIEYSAYVRSYVTYTCSLLYFTDTSSIMAGIYRVAVESGIRTSLASVDVGQPQALAIDFDGNCIFTILTSTFTVTRRLSVG